MATIEIMGYETDCNCEHCGRPLKHGIRISDGRVVGAICLDKKLTVPRIERFTGKKYRLGAEFIIRAAKVCQFYAPASWPRFQINAESLSFTAA